jgi:hypothetical protein
MAEVQRREGMEQTILAATALPPKPMQNIAHLWLVPRMRVRQTEFSSESSPVIWFRLTSRLFERVYCLASA